jgi:alpha-maltose-1-phosphate synthase
VAKTILMISLEYSPFLRSGLGTHVTNLVEALLERGYRIYVLTFVPKPMPVREQDNLTIIGISTDADDYSFFSRKTLPAFYATLSDRLEAAAIAILKQHNDTIDVIHCHDFHGIKAALALRAIFQVPVVSTVHLLHEPLMRWGGEVPPDPFIEMERQMCAESDHLIAVCSGYRDLIKYVHNKLDHSISVIPNGVDLSAFPANSPNSEIALRVRHDLSLTKERILIFGGRFTPQKSVVEIVQAAYEINRLRRDTVFLLAGHYESAAYASEVRQALRNFPLQRNSIRFLGKLSRAQLWQFYSAADVALIPSLYEGVPYSALEAIALGVPVVAAATCGIVDLISHRNSGLLVPLIGNANSVRLNPFDPRHINLEAFIEAQLELLDDVRLSDALKHEGRRQVANNNTIKAMMDAVTTVYDRF